MSETCFNSYVKSFENFLGNESELEIAEALITNLNDTIYGEFITWKKVIPRTNLYSDINSQDSSRRHVGNMMRDLIMTMSSQPSAGPSPSSQAVSESLATSSASWCCVKSTICLKIPLNLSHSISRKMCNVFNTLLLALCVVDLFVILSNLPLAVSVYSELKLLRWGMIDNFCLMEWKWRKIVKHK